MISNICKSRARWIRSFAGPHEPDPDGRMPYNKGQSQPAANFTPAHIMSPVKYVKAKMNAYGGLDIPGRSISKLFGCYGFLGKFFR